MRLLISMCIVAAVSSAVPLRAQSLGEVAKKEEERRKETKNTTKTYTNRDLPEPPAAPAPAPDSGATGATAAEPAPPPPSKTINHDAPSDPDDDLPAVGDRPAAAQDAAPKAQDPAKDRDAWQQRMRALREQVERNKTLAEALQTRLNSLDADLINRDDPAQRAKLATDRSRTAAELNRLKKAVEADEKAIPALEEEARRAGVPPGWLR